MDPTHSPDLKIFAREAFEALGSVIQDLDADTFEILIPDEWIPHFNGEDILRLRFSGESLLPAHEIFGLGMPVCESLISLLMGKGSLAKAYLNPVVKAGNLEEKFFKRIHWVHAKPFLKDQCVEETANAIFCFKVTFLTDDKTERLYRTAVNLVTRHPNDRLLEEWKNLFVEDAPSYQGIPHFRLPGLEDVFQKASAILRQKISPELDKIKTLQEKFFKRDLNHMQEYYGGLMAELEEKERRIQEGEAVLKRIQDRKTALVLDHKKKMSDIQEKYRLDIKAEAVNLLILYQPWVRMVWGVRTHEGELERIFYWDPVLKDFSNAICEKCFKHCEAFFVQDRKLICRTCREKV